MAIIDDSEIEAIKKPQDERPLTEEQAEEWLKCKHDKYYWMENYVKVTTPDGLMTYTPRKYQKRILSMIAENRFCIAISGRQTGKALDVSTPIPTPNGFKRMGDIEVGDYVIGSNGKPTLVTRAHPVMHNHTCYRVVFSTGDEIVADAEHLWTVTHKKRGVVTMTTQEILDSGLTVGNKNEKKYSIPNVKPVQYDEASLPIDPYIFGYWLGDGDSSGSKITVHNDDMTDLEKNLKGASVEYNIVSKNSDKNKNTNSINMLNVLSKLKALGVHKNKHIPEIYKTASIEQRIALVQGIMDSDGHASKRGGLELTFKSKRLIDDFREILCSLGKKVSNPKEKIVNTFEEGAIYYRIHFTIFREEFDAFRLERKLVRQKLRPHCTRMNSTNKIQISDIVPTESVPVRCIKVANKDSLFCAGRSYILTHNTQTLAVDVMHDIIFTSNYRVGMTSYTADNTQDLRDRVGEVYENLPMWMKPPVRVYNTKTIKFTNGSSVIFQVTGVKTFRGKSLHKIVVDEFAHVEEKIAEAFMTALLPSITGGGLKAKTKLIIISTPNGTSGEFARIWYQAKAKKNGYAWEQVDYNEIPNRGEEFEKEMLKKMSRNKFDQEYKCAFISDKGTLVNSRTIEAIETIDPVRSMGDMDLYVHNIRGRKLAMACDVSEGIGDDSHSFQVFDIDTFEQVAEYSNNVIGQNQYTKEIIRAIEFFVKEGCEEMYYTVENNGIGAGVIRLLENTENEYLDQAMFVTQAGSKRSGMATTKRTREAGCMQFKDMVEMEKLQINSESLKTEMKFFVKKGARFEAESGTHDDLVMACVILMNLLIELANYEDAVHDAVNELDVDSGDDCYDIFF
tara:strand:- start:1488 stop:4028 length:2541 start_codon:yes stop_codon:yes gene_type:complete